MWLYYRSDALTGEYESPKAPLMLGYSLETGNLEYSIPNFKSYAYKYIKENFPARSPLANVTSTHDFDYIPFVSNNLIIIPLSVQFGFNHEYIWSFVFLSYQEKTLPLEVLLIWASCSIIALVDFSYLVWNEKIRKQK